MNMSVMRKDLFFSTKQVYSDNEQFERAKRTVMLCKRKRETKMKKKKQNSNIPSRIHLCVFSVVFNHVKRNNIQIICINY